MDIGPDTIALLALVALAAGFIDAIAGGGGLLTVPAMLWAGIPPLQVLATNKLQSCFGVATACTRYHRRGLIGWRGIRLTLALVFVGAGLGAFAVQRLDAGLLALVVPVLLVAVAAYVLLSPRMGDDDARQRLGPAGYAPVAALIGGYDGFFGPGTGSFFTTSLVGLRGMGLTRAVGHTKALNLASNLASLAAFALGGQIIVALGLAMAAGAMSGAWLGSHFAIRFGARVIRPLLVAVSLALTARLLWQALG